MAKEIPDRLHPKRDQHAAHKLSRRGKLVCERLGAVADLIVDDNNMLEVAQRVVTNRPFNRLYSESQRTP